MSIIINSRNLVPVKLNDFTIHVLIIKKDMNTAMLVYLTLPIILLQAGFVISYLLLFGNEMLLTSFFFSGLLTISVRVSMQTVL